MSSLTDLFLKLLDSRHAEHVERTEVAALILDIQMESRHATKLRFQALLPMQTHDRKENKSHDYERHVWRERRRSRCLWFDTVDILGVGHYSELSERDSWHKQVSHDDAPKLVQFLSDRIVGTSSRDSVARSGYKQGGCLHSGPCELGIQHTC